MEHMLNKNTVGKLNFTARVCLSVEPSDAATANDYVIA